MSMSKRRVTVNYGRCLVVSPMGPFGKMSSGGPGGAVDGARGKPTILAAINGRLSGIVARTLRESAAGVLSSLWAWSREAHSVTDLVVGICHLSFE